MGTTKGGIIAWIKIDHRLVTEIDRLLMAYKKENADFRYIVRNGDRDIQVFIKRTSEGERCPYRELSLDVLGRISPLKTQIRETSQEKPEDEAEDLKGFSPTKKKDNC